MSEFKDEKFLAAVKRLQAVYDETQSAWLKKIGLGIVCVCKDGITEQSLVGYYWGKMCAPHDTCCYHALTNVRYTQIHAVIMLSQMLDTHNQSGLRRKVGKALQAMMCSTICR